MGWVITTLVVQLAGVGLALRGILQTWRRHGVSRKKSDPGDALVLVNILRTDMHAHRPLPADSDLAHVITVLARAQQDAVWHRQQLVDQVRSLLKTFYPAALDAFQGKQHGLARPEARVVLAAAPTSARAAKLSVRQPALAEILVGAGHAACSSSWRMPPRRSRLRTSRQAIWSGSAIGGGNGFSGRAFAMPWWGRWKL